MIGITSEMTAAGWGDRVREAALLPASYAWAVQRAGCVPIMLAPVPWHAASLAARLDGVLFSGGAAADGRRSGIRSYGEAGPADAARDEAEFALMCAAIEAGLPVLAICRGMQVLNVARGGSLVERPQGAADQGRPGPGPAERSARTVRISPDSRLGRLLGPSVAVDTAGGHQGVGRLGHGLTAVAWADDQAVEAVELAGHPFTVGMRWHPEESGDMRVFEEFRATAAAHAAARGAPGTAGGAGSTDGAGAGKAESTRKARGARKARAGTAMT